MRRAELPDQRPPARDLDHRIAEQQVRIAVRNGITAPGTPGIQVAGEVSSRKGESRNSADRCTRALPASNRVDSPGLQRTWFPAVLPKGSPVSVRVLAGLETARGVLLRLGFRDRFRMR